MIRASFVVALLALLLAAPAAALAAGCPRTTVSDLEDEVMCQVCGVPLALATDAPQARRERAFIARLVARCESKPAIKHALVAQFGSSVLAEPPHGGFDLTAYVVPVLALLLAALVVLGVWRSVREAPRRAGPEPLAAADAARVQAELERWEG